MCVCMCVFCSCCHLVQFLYSVLSRSRTPALLCSHLLYFLHIQYIFLIWKCELLLHLCTLFKPLLMLAFLPSSTVFSEILSQIFSQVSNKHNIQLFFSTSVIWLLVSRSHFMSDFQATLILMVKTVHLCTNLFEAALVCPFNAVIKIRWKSLPIVQHDWTQHVHINLLMRYEVVWIKYWKDVKCAVSLCDVLHDVLCDVLHDVCLCGLCG